MVFLDYGGNFCPRCGHWSPHLFDPDSIVRSRVGRIISVLVVCGWAGCREEREERL